MKISTNVWVSTSAVIALDTIKAREGYRSRNQTLEHLLEKYAGDQRCREEDQRLVHIATLLRWPPPRRIDRLTARRLGVVPSGRQLRVEVSEDLWTIAREYGFALPGQSIVRGHNEYQARRGGDAVLTSIARLEPLDDPEIGDIAQLLTRRQARRLWMLAIAGTSTSAEEAVLNAAERATEEREIAGARGESDRGPDRVERVAQKLLTSDVTWHASERFQRLKAIARERLTGDGAESHLKVLNEVGDDTERWRDESVNNRTALRSLAVREGRGATAVWRAEREIQIEDLKTWFGEMHRSSTPTTFSMNPPGWQLRFPTEWIPTLVNDATSRLMEDFRTGQVLQFCHEGTAYLWPTRENDEGLMAPVHGFETVVREAGDRQAWEVLEATLLDFSSTPHGDDGRQSVSVPANVAYDLGLLTKADRDRLVTQARTEYAVDVARSEGGHRYTPTANVDVLFADFDEKGYYRSVADRERARMAYARGFHPFLKYLGEINHPALISERLRELPDTVYRWPITTLADVVQTGALKADALRWLAAYVFSRHHAILNADVKRRWLRAEKYDEFSVTSTEYDIFTLDQPIDNTWAP